ncbi:TPA: hypothetical protein DF272_05680 [Candidatus Falkowbacteria bacterium]|nr:hypothetical protein [Candidatus Falkowbacteria bacterium]
MRGMRLLVAYVVFDKLGHRYEANDFVDWTSDMPIEVMVSSWEAYFARAFKTSHAHLDFGFGDDFHVRITNICCTESIFARRG